MALNLLQTLFLEMLIRNRRTLLQIKIKEIKDKVNGTSDKIVIITKEDETTTTVKIVEEEENLGIIPNHSVKYVETPHSHEMSI